MSNTLFYTSRDSELQVDADLEDHIAPHMNSAVTLFIRNTSLKVLVDTEAS